MFICIISQLTSLEARGERDEEDCIPDGKGIQPRHKVSRWWAAVQGGGKQKGLNWIKVRQGGDWGSESVVYVVVLGNF